jgi:hypothetical protein
VRNLLKELESTGFSGFCTMSLAKETSILVLDKGRVILAKHRELRGDKALQEIRLLEGLMLDAELTDFNATQLGLATEFNKQYIVKDGNRPGVTFGSGASRPQETKPAPAAPSPAITRLRVRSSPADREIGENDWLDDIKETDVAGIVNQDLAALERIDLESMTEKIRNTCKSTVQRLDLGHLMDENGK